MLHLGIAGDREDYDRLMKAEMDDDLEVPQLGLFGDESVISDEEESEDE
jgi:hypothetical protein